MGEANGVVYQAVDRRKSIDAEWPNERNDAGSPGCQEMDLIFVTMDRDALAHKRGDPARREVVPIEVREAEGGNIAKAHPVPSRRLASVRGPMPASISKTPLGERTIDAFPADPLASTQSSSVMG